MMLQQAQLEITPASRFKRPSRGTACRAFTLMEMMLALLILSMISVAICTLTFGAMNCDRFLRSTNTAQSEVEMAMRRISNNIRTAQTGSITVGSGTLSSLTQSDPTNGYVNGATVAYSLQTVAGQNNLVEVDQRYGTNTLVHNVTTFTVAAVSGITNLYQVDLVVGSQVKEERHVKIFARN